MSRYCVARCWCHFPLCENDRKLERKEAASFHFHLLHTKTRMYACTRARAHTRNHCRTFLRSALSPYTLFHGPSLLICSLTEVCGHGDRKIGKYCRTNLNSLTEEEECVSDPVGNNPWSWHPGWRFGPGPQDQSWAFYPRGTKEEARPVTSKILPELKDKFGSY